MKNRIRPLCETPRDGIFCGPDKYLTLQEHTITSEMFPVMEYDSYFILVKEGHGNFVINGEEFSVEPGCVSWIQCSQVLTVCPDFGNNLVLWICPYDYQLLSYYSFSNITPTRELEIVNNLPVIGPDGDEVKEIVHLFHQYRKLSKRHSHGSAIIRSSYLRRIELLYNRFAKSMKSHYKFSNLPLSRKVSLYIAVHSTTALTCADVVKAVAPSISESALNHALLVATGLNFNQYLNRLRIAHAMSYFLYDSLPFDYISSISGFNMEIPPFQISDRCNTADLYEKDAQRRKASPCIPHHYYERNSDLRDQLSVREHDRSYRRRDTYQRTVHFREYSACPV